MKNINLTRDFPGVAHCPIQLSHDVHCFPFQHCVTVSSVFYLYM